MQFNFPYGNGTAERLDPLAIDGRDKPGVVIQPQVAVHIQGLIQLLRLVAVNLLELLFVVYDLPGRYTYHTGQLVF